MMTRRIGLTTLAASLASACSPLSLFATLTPKDAARREARQRPRRMMRGSL